MAEALRRGLVLLLLVLSGCAPARPYDVVPALTIREPSFAHAVEAPALSAIVDGNRLQILKNGGAIFPAVLAAIRDARTSITFANYLYEDGDVSLEMAEALAGRYRGGVGVNVLIDAIESSSCSSCPFRNLL